MIEKLSEGLNYFFNNPKQAREKIINKIRKFVDEQKEYHRGNFSDKCFVVGMAVGIGIGSAFGSFCLYKGYINELNSEERLLVDEYIFTNNVMIKKTGELKKLEKERHQREIKRQILEEKLRRENPFYNLHNATLNS